MASGHSRFKRKGAGVVKSEIKPIEEIRESLNGYKKILNIGCGGCSSVCLSGGQREVSALNLELNTRFKTGSARPRVTGLTIERQCNLQYFSELRTVVSDCDCLLSMACGAGVQLVAETFPDIPVFPALNTVSIGIDREVGVFEEKCRACGHCVLAYTGGICPVTCCAKGLFNGPCGGTAHGMCEIGNDTPCAWLNIYERLKAQNRLDDILKIRPPMAWRNQVMRLTVQAPYARKDRK